MYCDSCHQKPATIKIVQILNGEKVLKYYCEDCAHELDLDTPVSLQDFFKGMIDMSMNGIFPTVPSKKAVAKQSFKCPECGITYDEFRKIGKVGCGNCYSIFKKQIEAILKNVHGSSVHTGKIPHKLGATLLVKREVDALRKQISKAVEIEDYEKAAVLRDKIRELAKSLDDEAQS